MRTKKILLALTLVTLPLILIVNPLGTEVNNTQKLNKIVKNLYLCYDLQREQREDCFLLNLKTKLSLTDNLFIIKKINTDTQTNGKIKNLCHELTHLIGSNAYTTHEDNSLISGYESCGQGYYHGIMNEILIKKDKGEKGLTNFCAKTSPDSNALGLCYHGIGHTLLNIIPTKNDKEFVKTLINSCLDITSSDKINKVTRNLSMLCFTGGFEEYLRIKYLQDLNQTEKPSSTICQSIDLKFIKYCYSIVTVYELIEQMKNSSQPLDTIYQTFGEKCKLLPSKTENDIKIKEGCYVALAKSYANVVLTGDANNENITSPKLADLKTEELYALITKICTPDFNNNCTFWFLLELNEKLLPSDLDALVAKFENFSLKDLFDYVF